MSLKYHLIQLGNPAKTEVPKKYYAKAIHTDEVNLRELANELSRISSLSIGDVYSVMWLLADTIPRLVGDGKIVRLGDLGSFFAEIESNGAEAAADFHPNLIRKIKLQFRAGKELKKGLAQIDVEKA
ncbi:DNA-binding protein [candidate division KSB1 bacterium]|nr:DNA-binding protein [candidate division KSB1 bacterium]